MQIKMENRETESLSETKQKQADNAEHTFVDRFEQVFFVVDGFAFDELQLALIFGSEKTSDTSNQCDDDAFDGLD